MKEYLVTFRPLGPYFFGNERGFRYSNQEPNRYYIRSENLPSQSGILGTIRYILLPVKKSDWNYSPEELALNNAVVGTFGFDPERKSGDYGKIKEISPVFLYGKNGALVSTPFDHNSAKQPINQTDDTEKEIFYTPFSEYATVDIPGGGKKLYTAEFDTKSGLPSSYMQVVDGKIISAEEIFKSDVRVGINRTDEEGGFFKKEYKVLQDGFCFGVYLSVEDDVAVPENTTVSMGQGKSSFYVSFCEQKEKNSLVEDVAKHLRGDVIYCVSHAFLSSDIYQKTLFAATKTTTYRHFQKQKNQVRKSDTLYHIVEAGSIFIPCDKALFLQQAENEALSTAGYNRFSYHKEEV